MFKPDRLAEEGQRFETNKQMMVGVRDNMNDAEQPERRICFSPSEPTRLKSYNLSDEPALYLQTHKHAGRMWDYLSTHLQ